MADMRASSFLPTIKCSMCARDIEISQMGDHVCGGAGEPTPPPDSYGNFDKMYKQEPTNGPSFLKPGKQGKSFPPRVDTNAANRPFFPPDQLTPVSASQSPVTPGDGRRSPNLFARPGLARTNTALSRAPPSPEVLSSNLDCAFPPFPTAKAAQSKPPVGAGYGGFGTKYPESNPMYAPLSPRNVGNGGLLQRMNTIAPGPFDINSRKGAGTPDSGRGHRRQATSGSLKDMTMSSSAVGNTIQRPSTAGPGHSRTSTTSSNGSKNGAAPRMPRTNGYGGFGPPRDDDPEPLNSESRSQTFPRRNEVSDELFRRPSEPASSLRRPSTEQRSVSGSPPRRKGSVGPDLSRPLPPRGASMLGRRAPSRNGDAPPIPSHVNLAEEFGIGNPYHTPSESQSSDNSIYSEQSHPSSRSSPPRDSGRKASDVGKMDGIIADLSSSMSDLPPKRLQAYSPPRNQYARPLQPPRNLGPSLLAPESPMDPAMQSGRRSPVARIQTPPQSRSRSPLGARNRTGTNSSRPATSKGNCKGCGEAIYGKSVSSADGRLTGRYHKQCFNCTTCSEPFQTATFYVIDDAPYCERHYHKLNGSVCQTCDRGIEGQYLESEGKQKFHPDCLTCSDCNRTLRNDYFEMDGRVYCERDAFRRAQQGRGRGRGPFLGAAAGGTSRMERRTTRLMMM